VPEADVVLDEPPVWPRVDVDPDVLFDVPEQLP